MNYWCGLTTKKQNLFFFSFRRTKRKVVDPIWEMIY